MRPLHLDGRPTRYKDLKAGSSTSHWPAVAAPLPYLLFRTTMLSTSLLAPVVLATLSLAAVRFPHLAQIHPNGDNNVCLGIKELVHGELVRVWVTFLILPDRHS